MQTLSSYEISLQMHVSMANGIVRHPTVIMHMGITDSKIDQCKHMAIVYTDIILRRCLLNDFCLFVIIFVL